MTSLLVVVPTYEECHTIAEVVFAVTDQGHEILVVDDGSPDGTAEVVARLGILHHGVHLLRRPAKAGLGSAYRDGLAWGLRAGRYDLLGQMDADLSHDPRDLSRLVDAVVTTPADLAIGSRYVAGGATEGWSSGRRLLSRAGNGWSRLCTGVDVQDATAGFRVWRAAVVRDLGLCDTTSEGYSFQVETTLRAWVAGSTIVEVPIVFRERVEGASKMSGAVVREAAWRVARWGPDVRRTVRRRAGAEVARAARGVRV